MTKKTPPLQEFTNYLVYMTLSCAFVLSMIAGINLAVDPANFLLDGDIEQKIAQAFEDGFNVQGANDIDGIALQKHRISLMHEPPHTAVIGSSRAMTIRDGFTDGTLVNHSVSSAGLSQICMILREYMVADKLPTHVLLVLDPWVFNAGAQDDKMTLLPAGCIKFAPNGFSIRGAPEVERLQVLPLQFISLSYLRSSLTKIRYHGENAISPYWRRLSNRVEVTNDLPLPSGGWLRDGSIVYPMHSGDLSRFELHQSAQAYALKKPVYNLGYFKKLSPLYIATLERILTILAELGVEVSMLLPPYHPVTAQILSDNPTYGPIILEAEEKLKALAEEHRLRFYGSYFSNQCDEMEFFDGMHPRQSCMAKILGVEVPERYIAIGPR